MNVVLALQDKNFKGLSEYNLLIVINEILIYQKLKMTIYNSLLGRKILEFFTLGKTIRLLLYRIANLCLKFS